MTYQASSVPSERDVQGYARLLLKRDRGKIIFATVRWEERIMQLIFEADATDGFERMRHVPLGSLLHVSGIEGVARSGTPSIFVRQFSIVGMNSRGLPDKWHGLSQGQRYQQRALDLMTNQSAFAFMGFVSISTSILRSVLDAQRYREFNTGTLQERFEGGLAASFETKAHFNGKTYYLSLTSELKLKRLILAGFDRVYEIGQTFRNEGVNPICIPEHTLLEAYAVGSTLESQLQLVEALGQRVAREHNESGTVAFIDRSGASQLLDFTCAFARIRFIDAYRAYVDPSLEPPSLARLCERYPTLFKEGMSRYTWLMKAIEILISPHFVQPTFLTHLPAGMSPFVQVDDEDRDVTKRAFFICGGLFLADIYVDENDPIILAHALHAQARTGEGTPNDEFLELIQYGMPPTAGFGIGLKRFMLLFRGELPFNIRETVPFPL